MKVVFGLLIFLVMIMGLMLINKTPVNPNMGNGLENSSHKSGDGEMKDEIIVVEEDENGNPVERSFTPEEYKEYLKTHPEQEGDYKKTIDGKK